MSGATVGTALLDGLNHNYTGGEELVAATIGAWLRRSTLGWPG